MQVTKNHQYALNVQDQNLAIFNLHKASELIMNMGNHHGIQSGQYSDEPSSSPPGQEGIRIDDTYDHASIGEQNTKLGKPEDNDA